jgi:hypothetical protein
MPLPESNYTQIPNIILDSIHQMKEAEVKVILFICRQTLGFHRQSYRLSLKTIREKTGLSKQCVIYTCQALIDRDWIERHRDGEGNGSKATYAYSLKIESFNPTEPGVKKVDPNEVQKVDPKDENQGSKKLTPGVKKVDPNEVQKVDPKDGIGVKKVDPYTDFEEDSNLYPEELSGIDSESLKKKILNKDLLKKEIKERSEPEQPFSLGNEEEQDEEEQPVPEETPLPDSSEQIPSLSTDLGSDQKKGAAQREIVTSMSYQDPRYNSAARMEDAWNARATAPYHAYPEMVQEGFGHLWIGKSKRDRNEFDPNLIKAVQGIQQKRNLPCEQHDALIMIGNCIRRKEWETLDVYAKAAEKIVDTARQIQEANTPTIPSDTPEMTPEPPQSRMTPEMKEMFDRTRKTLEDIKRARQEKEAQARKERWA